MSHLVSYNQISGNLRRTAENGLISLLNHQQLEDLAFKYFGIKDEYGNIIGYQCPYSGKVYTDYKDIVLEHIVPVASKGGSVLFNCIPTSKEVNGLGQKGAKHLIHWWTSSKHWNQDAPNRLEKIVNYMLDGYEQVFKEYTVEEVESSYLDIETNESILDEEKDKDINARTESKLLKQAKNNGIHSYLGFIYDCINTLEKYNINTRSIKEKLQQLQVQNIFKDIDKYQLYQNIIQKLIVSRIGDDTRSYLTYTLNFDIKKMMDSINLDNEQDIYNELNRRLQNVEKLLRENNLSTIEYFKSLKDIQDIDILYKNNISLEEIQSFLENIKIGIDTKIDIFIDMLSDKQYTYYENGKTKEYNIFNRRNKIPFKGYESIGELNIGSFWANNSSKIIERLNYLETTSKSNEETEKYRIAKRKIEEYEFVNNLEKRIDKFIEMLIDKQYTSYQNGNPNENNIFSSLNKIAFKGYESIDGLYASKLWEQNSDKIKERLNYLEMNSKNNEEKYQKVRKAIKEYEFQCKTSTSGLILRIDKFIEMLSDKQYTSYQNGKPNENNIFSSLNKIAFKGYESIDGLYVSKLWAHNSDKIKERLNYLKMNSKNNEEKYQKARKAIEEYEFQCDSGINLRIDKFIEMLSDKQYTSYTINNNGRIVPDSNNIFSQLNKIPFKDYESIEHINTSKLWSDHSENIKKRIVELEHNPNSIEQDKYQKARKAIEEYEFQCDSGINLRIDKFIEMLAEKQYTSYTINNNGKIVPDSNNIFSSLNKIPFKDYESLQGLNISRVWSENSYKLIIPLLFFNKQYDNENKVYIDSKKDYSIKEYDIARNAVLEYLKVKDIHEYINKLEKKEKKNSKVLELINLRNNLRKTLELLRIEESKLIAENNQLQNEYINMQEEIETRRAV